MSPDRLDTSVDEASAAEPDRFCARCGEPNAVGAHDTCARALALEPPRYCPRCRRRMTVQVTPADWTARCSEHGEVTASTWGPA